MSTYTYLACRDCKKYMRMGQSDFIYTGHPEMLETLQDFLVEHSQHTLAFLDDSANADELYAGEYGEYEEIDWHERMMINRKKSTIWRIINRLTRPSMCEQKPFFIWFLIFFGYFLISQILYFWEKFYK